MTDDSLNDTMQHTLTARPAPKGKPLEVRCDGCAQVVGTIARSTRGVKATNHQRPARPRTATEHVSNTTALAIEWLTRQHLYAYIRDGQPDPEDPRTDETTLEVFHLVAGAIDRLELPPKRARLAAIELWRAVAQLAEAETDIAAKRASSAGLTWQQIGAAARISRQAAHKRWS